MMDQEFQGALRAMQARRDAAFFFDAAVVECDRALIPVRPLSLRLSLLLEYLGSPYLTGGLSRLPLQELPGRNAQFLWAVSPEFTPAPADRVRFVAEVVDPLDPIALSAGIQRFVDEAMADHLPGPSGRARRVPFASLAAVMVDLFAREYGWAPDITLNLPLAQLWQFEACIRHFHDPQSPMVNPETDRAAQQRRARLRATAMN